jgi:hypothetical protein
LVDSMSLRHSSVVIAAAANIGSGPGVDLVLRDTINRRLKPTPRKGSKRVANAPFPARAVSLKCYFLQRLGEVAEWLKAPHSKCGIRVTVSGVRIPPSPPVICVKHMKY